MWNPDTANWLNGASGLVLVLLGLWIASIKPRRHATRALAWFVGMFGAGFVLTNIGDALTDGVDSHGPSTALAALARFAAAAAALRLAYVFPRKPVSKWIILGPVLFAGPVFLVTAYAFIVAQVDHGFWNDAQWPLAGLIHGIAFWHMGSAMLVLLASGGARTATGSNEISSRSGLLMIAILPYMSLISLGEAANVVRGGPWAQYWWYSAYELGFVYLMLVAFAYWLRALLVKGGPTLRLYVLFFAAIVAFAGFAIWQGWHYNVRSSTVLIGSLRLFMAGALTFAILRHQLLGLDVKLKWTVKQSTVAAIFVGVIFLASEGAQLIWDDDQAWVGLLAGGAMIFALAPVQRFAERVAARAVPGVKPILEMDDNEKLYTFQQAARAAWADGILSKDERTMLESLRKSLGLSHAQAAQAETAVAQS